MSPDKNPAEEAGFFAYKLIFVFNCLGSSLHRFSFLHCPPDFTRTLAEVVKFSPATGRHILMHSSMRFVPGRRIEKIESKGVSPRVMVEFYGI